MRQSVFLTLFAACIVGLVTAGCPRVDDPGPASVKSAVVEPTQVEPPAPIVEPVADPAAEATRPPKMVRRAVVTAVSVVRVEAERAENGSGAMIVATAPVAIEIAAEEWPVRALDPVLHVGNLEFRHYTFPRPNVLQYVVADGALLPAGAAAWIQYGEDVASRVEVAQSLEVPR